MDKSRIYEYIFTIKPVTKKTKVQIILYYNMDIFVCVCGQMQCILVTNALFQIFYAKRIER